MYYSIILFLIETLRKIRGIIIPLLLAIAYATLLERKALSSFQRRRGPNAIGWYGRRQPLADGLKLFLKETILPSQANRVIFLVAPIRTFMLSLVSWAAVPFSKGVVYADLSIGILFLFAISSLSVYGVIIAGWGSNSKYPFLGALRSAAQMISYEVSIGIIILTVLVCSGSINLTNVVLAQDGGWFVCPLWPSFLIFFVSALAETNRAPFDLPEAEAELVSGYNVEYSAIGFALFFLGEYSHMILMSLLTAIFFFGGWLPRINRSAPGFMNTSGFFILGRKTVFFLWSFIWVRATFPRYRYDQLMRLGWKVFLPLALAWLLIVCSVVYLFHYYAEYLILLSFF